ncbi:copper-binding periplasmic metallochaperone CueP [Pectobacterium brasiliense]|uniref:copper-binding periplasmic metallochaperone CueP n=1 Tax=Pectobacterium brasiliense TaxID=180957 RepID=UPI003D9B6689
MMKLKMMAALFGLTLSSAGFAATADANAFLAKQGLAGKTVEQIVDVIDQSPQARPLPYSASITSKALKLSDGQQQYSYPLGNKFYLSFAPYIQQTHPCFNHSLSGCQGELTNTAFDVKITDKAGNVIVQKTLSSHQNGFVGVWLPRNIEGTINVTYQGRVASSPFATYDDSQTCMTTLPLKEA